MSTLRYHYGEWDGKNRPALPRIYWKQIYFAGVSMETCNYLYDVSMSYVNPGWQERYCELVKRIDRYLKKNYAGYFAGLQLYQTGPMNYVVVAVYYDVPGVSETLPCILHYVNEEYRDAVGHNVRRKQILKFDRARRLHGQPAPPSDCG